MSNLHSHRGRCLMALASAGCLLIGPLAPARASAPDDGEHRAHPRLNDTGLTRCTRDSRHWTKDCAGTGQDAEFGRDATARDGLDGHAGFAFRKVCNSGEQAGTGTCTKDAALGAGPDDWGCTYDRATALMWEMKLTDGGLHDAAARYPNVGDHSAGDASSFVDAVDAAGLCGASDWRLPTTYELQGIVDFGRASPDPSIDAAWFPNTFAEHYWASEPYVGQEATVSWMVSFVMDPRNVDIAGWVRTQPYPVRLVRDTLAAVAEEVRFRPTLRPDEVLDTRAHLIWRRCAEGWHWDGTTCVGGLTLYGFQDALAHAASEAAASGLTWRVPNAKELHSIVDTSRQHPAIRPHVFPHTNPDKFWTSTAYAWTATGGWAVDFDDGGVLAYRSDLVESLRLVRDED